MGIETCKTEPPGLRPEPMAAAADGWCSLVEAAAVLDCSPDTVRRRIGRGELRGRRVPTPHGLAWQVCLEEPTARQSAAEGGQHGAEPAEPAAEQGPQAAELASAALVGLVERLSTANAALSEEVGYLRARLELLDGLRLLAAPLDLPARRPWWRWRRRTPHGP